MGTTITLASVALGVGIALAASAAIYGIYYGVQYIFRKVDESNHEIDAKGTGENMHDAGINMIEDFHKNDIQIDPNVQNDLQKSLSKMKNDKYNTYNVTFNIKKINGEIKHKPQENEKIMVINKRFNKSYSYKEKYINLSHQGSSFGNEYLVTFSKIVWENIIDLNLSYNNITIIDSLLDVNLFQLKKLDLSHNLIKDIDKFDKIQITDSNPLEIDLKNNKIKNPFAFLHEKFEKIELLDISHNMIEYSIKTMFRESFEKKNIKCRLIL